MAGHTPVRHHRKGMAIGPLTSDEALAPTKAIVFDLFGTLVPWPQGSTHRHVMAQRLAVDYETFRAAWSESWRARNAGEMDAIGALRTLCENLSVRVDEERIRFAASAWTDFLQKILVPRDGAVETIAQLRAAGFRIGLMSDSPLEVPVAWPETALAPLVDEAVFSCTERVVKPDPRLYAAIARRLAVEPVECLYVGNGDGEELAGAVRSGMSAVLFSGSGETLGREAETWPGPRIARLADTLGLVRLDPNARRVRRAVASDAPGLRLLLNTAYRPLAAAGMNFTAATQDDALTREHIQAREVYVMERAGEPIGTITLRDRSDEHGLRHIYINGLAVRPDLQRQGLGRELLAFAEKVASERGITLLRLDTAKPAGHLIRLYRRAGYQTGGERHWKGKTYDSVVMEKSLVDDG